MEFQIITDMSALPKTIDFNFDAMRQELDTKLEQYRSLVVTEDSIKDAAKDRAALNKLSQAIDARRREIKKQCLAPYESFESKCKELTSMINEASRSIDSQIKAFEDMEKSQKRQQLEDAWDFVAEGLTDVITFSQVFSPKWLNKTVKVDAAMAEMEARVSSIRKDIQALRSMHLSNEVPALAKYYETLDLSAAISENLRLQKLALEEDRKKPPVESAQDVEEPAPPKDYSFRPDSVVSVPIQEDPKTIKVIFYNTTAAFRAEMRALTEKYGVKYGGIN